MLAILLLFSIIPYSSAAEIGGIAMLDASMSLDGDGELGSGTIWFNLTLSEVDGADANVSISAVVTDSLFAPLTPSAQFEQRRG